MTCWNSQAFPTGRRYFPNIHETLTDEANPLNFDEELKQIDVCALGPLRCTYALHKKNLLKNDGSSRVVIRSSSAALAASSSAYINLLLLLITIRPAFCYR